MKSLRTIKFTLDEKQFTQLAYDYVNKKFIVSVYFRCLNSFKTLEFKEIAKAEELYTKMI